MNVSDTAAYAFLIFMVGQVWPTLAVAQDQLGHLFSDGAFSGQLRYRYEHVYQDGPPPVNHDANASTLRVNLGYKTGEYKKIRGFVEGQAIFHLGEDRFNDMVNGRTSYPTVVDPDIIELNQSWLSWSGISGVELKLGRQVLNLDNQRFIGSVDWRQNDQTFDAVIGSYSDASRRLQLQYGYIWNVNRIFGNDYPLGDLETISHILRSSYQFSTLLNVVAYGYWLDFDRLPSSSSRTIGLRTTGKAIITEALSFNYEAEYALQEDFASNPLSYSEGYNHLSIALAYKGIAAGLGRELLGGNNTIAFQTPLATLHKFNGWSDKFLATPATGLKDRYASLGYKFGEDKGLLAKTELAGIYHDFSGDSVGDYGHELNVSLSKVFEYSSSTVFKTAVVTFKYADYTAKDAPYTDTQKVWLQLSTGF